MLSAEAVVGGGEVADFHFLGAFRRRGPWGVVVAVVVGTAAEVAEAWEVVVRERWGREERAAVVVEVGFMERVWASSGVFWEDWVQPWWW